MPRTRFGSTMNPSSGGFCHTDCRGLRSLARAHAVLRSLAPAFHEASPYRRASLYRWGFPGWPPGGLHPILRRVDGREADFYSSRRCHLADDNHGNRLLLHPKRKSATAPPVDDPELRGRAGLRGSPRCGRCDRMGKPRQRCYRSHSMGLPFPSLARTSSCNCRNFAGLEPCRLRRKRSKLKFGACTVSSCGC